MSMSADFLNMLPPKERAEVVQLMKDNKLVLCDSLDEALAAIKQLTGKGFNPPV